MNHYGKEKFDSEGEKEAKIGTEISFDSSILKERNKKSYVLEREMGNSWKVTISTA